MKRQEEALAWHLGQALEARGMTLVTVESCTGGWIAKQVTDVPGSSQWFQAGLVTYSNASKHRLLGVPQAVFETAGAVSRACVEAMATGALERVGGDIAVAVSGIAGPGGGSAEKPVGTVWFAFAQAAGTLETERCQFWGDRDTIRRTAVAHALKGLLDRVGRG